MNSFQVEVSDYSENLDSSVFEDKDGSPIPILIFESMGVKLLDEDPDLSLQLYTYLDCTNNDSIEKKQCRGLIYEDGKLIVSTFPYSDEYSHLERKELETKLTRMSDWEFFDSFEGTLVRFYCVGGVWKLSTHRKLDAFRSKWSCRKSFGELFLDGLMNESVTNDRFQLKVGSTVNEIFEQLGSLLNPKRVHTFLIGNNDENRIVCNGNGKLYYIGSFGLGDRDFLSENPLNFPCPKKREFETLDSLLAYVDQLSYRELQGIFCYNKSTATQLKIVHNEYRKLFAVRGNQPSLRYRYLQVRMDRELRERFLNLYPNSKKDFEEYENYLKKVAEYIYNSYVNNFILKKPRVTLPKSEYIVMQACHAWHKEDRDRNKISLEKVMKILNSQSPPVLNGMIKRVKAELESVNLPQQPWTYRSPYLSAVLSGPAVSNLRSRGDGSIDDLSI